MANLHDLLAAHAADELDGMTEEDERSDELVALGLLLVEVARYEAGPWRRDGACRGVHPDVFHRRGRSDAAIALCLSCPVLEECREWALSLPDDVDKAGVAGGMEASERRSWRRSRAA